MFFKEKKKLECGIYFTLISCLNLDAKFSSEVLDLYLDFIRCKVENTDPRTQVVPNKF